MNTMSEKDKLKILVVSSEVAPFAQVGGLAEFASALPKALESQGHDVRVVLPRYRQIDGERYALKRISGSLDVDLGSRVKRAAAFETILPDSEVNAYFIWDERYFHRDGVYGFDDDPQRFAFFARAVLALVEKLDWKPDVIHCNDWHTALIPMILDTARSKYQYFQDTVTVFSIHNLGYQGEAGRLILRFAGLDESLPLLAGIEQPGQFNFMARGIAHSDMVSTVSPSYGKQIVTDEWGGKLAPLLRKRGDRLMGVLRGFDSTRWNPETDEHIVRRYTEQSIDDRIENKLALLNELGLPVKEDTPLIGMVGRLVDQKGCDIAVPTVRRLMRGDGGEAFFVLLGLGLRKYHTLFGTLAVDFVDKARVFFKFDDALAHRIFAGSDMLIMPSLYEPCGTGQMISMRYGCIPIVHSVGGLADTVTDVDQGGLGFTFDEYDVNAFWEALQRAMVVYHEGPNWRELQKEAMKIDFSWNVAVRDHISLYRSALKAVR
ncbi:MAG: glycogen/starch synthase [Chloroflexota bacterium]